VISRSSTSEYLLGPSAYISPKWFEQERATLFESHWALVASVDELQAAGDYVTTTVGRAPVLVIRGDDGELRAFHNLCRHRGMRLLQDHGTVNGLITCFYHQWRYALDGALEVVPQRKDQFPDLDASCWGLLPAAVATWEGMVFVHPDPQAPPLRETLGSLPDYLGSHRPGKLVQVVHVRLDAHCNWKLFVENHVDVYHLWYLHDKSLGDFDHTRFEKHQLGSHWASHEPLRDADVEAAVLTRGTTQIAHLDDRDRLGIGAHLVFPNLMMATAAEFFATYVAEPVDPDHTVIDLRIRAEPDADPDALRAALCSFIDEDVRACEAVQAGIRSPAFSVGPLAREHERPITDFHHHVLAAVEGARRDDD
jgi:choline monooxygenase